MNLAMSLKGSRRRKYQCMRIQRSHFLATANEVGFNENSMNDMLDEMASKTEQVISQVAAKLPLDSPAFIAEPIFAGMRKYSQRL